MSEALIINERGDSCDTEDDDRSKKSFKTRNRKRKGRGFDFGFTDTSNCEESCNSKKFHESENELVDYPEQSCTPLKSEEGWILFVTNLHEEACDEDVETLFSSYGRISTCRLNLDRRTGFSKGYVIIEFRTFAEAELARLECDGAEILGKTISVNWCFVKEPRRILRRKTYL